MSFSTGKHLTGLEAVGRAAIRAFGVASLGHVQIDLGVAVPQLHVGLGLGQNTPPFAGVERSLAASSTTAFVVIFSYLSFFNNEAWPENTGAIEVRSTRAVPQRRCCPRGNGKAAGDDLYQKVSQCAYFGIAAVDDVKVGRLDFLGDQGRGGLRRSARGPLRGWA